MAFSYAQSVFALDVLRRLSSKENALISPASVSSALGMTALGARGDTARAFEEVLRVKPGRLSRIHAQLGAPLPEDPGFTATVANRLFARKGLNVLAEFREALARHYRAAIETLDFSDSDVARARINGWVDHQTKGLIKGILAPPKPDADSRLILVNALYLKALWASPFDSGLTREGSFYRTPRTPVLTDFMHQQAMYDYAESALAQLVVLPYRGGRYEAIVVLPRAEVTGWRQEITAEAILSLREKTRAEDVSLGLPRFDLEWGMDLAEVLGPMGLQVAFGATADFSGIAAEPILISGVSHKVRLRVHEKGTEVAAATAVDMDPLGIPEPGIEVRVDRPFLLLIREVVSGAFLLFARIEDPRPGSGMEWRQESRLEDSGEGDVEF